MINRSNHFVDKMPKAAQNLVSQAYSSISAESLAEILGGSPKEALSGKCN